MVLRREEEVPNYLSKGILGVYMEAIRFNCNLFPVISGVTEKKNAHKSGLSPALKP